jgi:hypothetical protein
MPSKYMVSVVLDNETIEIWEGLPVGERSKRVREALRTAEIVAERDSYIKALQSQNEVLNRLVKKLELKIVNFETFGVDE